MRRPRTSPPVRRAASAVVAFAIAALVGAAVTQPAAAAEPLPVPYTLLAALAAPPHSSPPGSNNFSCKPSKAHPNPVVLLHGLSANMAVNWQTFSPLLKNEGYCVFALTYGVPAGTPAHLDQIGGLNALETSAEHVSVFIDKVLKSTGARKVDLLGHSEGTVISGYYTKFIGPSKVGKVVALTPLWDGTSIAGVNYLSTMGSAFGLDPLVDGALRPLCVSCRGFAKDSPFMKKLRSGGIAVKGVSYTNIVTKYDELVIPYTSGIYPGMKNITVQDKCAIDFSEHGGLMADPVAASHVLNALDPAHPRPLTCVLVTPLLALR